MMMEGTFGLSAVLLAVCSVGLVVTVPAGIAALMRGNMRRLLHAALTGAVLFAVALIAALMLNALPAANGLLA